MTEADKRATNSSRRNSPLLDPLLTIGQVGQVLQFSERSVRRLIQVGDLPAIRVGRSPRVREADLRAFLESAPSYYESETDKAE